MAYRPGGFILHPGVLAVVLIAVPVWLGLFFAGESTHGVVGIVVAVLLVVLGLWLGYFVSFAVTFEAIGVTMWLSDRTERKRRRHRRRRARGTADSGTSISPLRRFYWLPYFLASASAT
jgi:hypothetical protein